MREQILERLRWAYKRSPRVVRKTLTPLRDLGADYYCPLPSFYLENFESRDSLRITTLDWIRRHAPNDWEKIKFWCPLIEAEYVRQMERR